MKSNLIYLKKISIICFFIAFVLPSKTLAQNETRTFNWASYNTTLKIPADLTVTANDSSHFVASNYNTNLSIYPRKLTNYITSDQMKKNLLQWMGECGVTNIEEYYNFGILDNNYYGLAYTAKKNNSTILIAYLQDPDFPKTTMFVWAATNDNDISKAKNLLMGITPKEINPKTTKSFDWSSYNARLIIPVSLNVTANDSSHFIASNSQINLSIYPRKLGSGITSTQMKTNLQQWITECGVTNVVLHYSYGFLNNKYYGLAYTAKKNNSTILLAYLQDPDFPKTTLYVWISSTNNDIAKLEEILTGITPIKTNEEEDDDYFFLF